MKTTNSITRKIKSTITGLTLTISTALLITSCQKEEMQQPSSANNSTESAKLIDHVLPIDLLAFSSIKIDHLPANSLLPNYSVTVNSNGTARYEGRANVGVKKIINFELTKKQLQYINQLCFATDFFNIKEINWNVPDLPIVSTTFTNGKQTRKLSDSDGIPQELVSFRSNIEYALDIAKYVKAGVANPTTVETR